MEGETSLIERQKKETPAGIGTPAGVEGAPENPWWPLPMRPEGISSELSKPEIEPDVELTAA
jgi:hypothetical protein